MLRIIILEKWCLPGCSHYNFWRSKQVSLTFKRICLSSKHFKSPCYAYSRNDTKKVPGNKPLIAFTINQNGKSIAQITCYDVVTLNISWLSFQKQHINCLECISKNIMSSMTCWLSRVTCRSFTVGYNGSHALFMHYT